LVLPILRERSRMRYFEASSVIAAGSEAVWAVLSDGPGPSFERFAGGLKLRVESGG
jgi:hypothetical protein